MKKNKKEVNVLDELNKGATMGVDAVNFILEKAEEKKFIEFLEHLYNNYKNISNSICELYPEYSDKEPHETNAMNKVMTWYGIEMKTMTDKTTSKLAELVMQGVNMGIIEGRRLLNHKESEEEINKLVSEYVNMQEDAVEKLKEFL